MSKVTLEDIHECLIGNKLAGQKGIISTIDDLVESHSEMNDKVCIMQNQLYTLMQDREKRIEAERNKLTIGKALRKIDSLFISAKTGL